MVAAKRERGRRLKLVVLGLSLSSSWGNGHATTYRALLKAFAARGHEVLFLERDVPWYAAHRDLADPDFCRLALYRDLGELDRWRGEVAGADAVIVGSYVPDGVAVGAWMQATATGVRAFYDIDTPVTLAKLAARRRRIHRRRADPGVTTSISRSPAGRRSPRWRALRRAAPPAPSTARSTPATTGRWRWRGGGTSATSAPTAPTASRRSSAC